MMISESTFYPNAHYSFSSAPDMRVHPLSASPSTAMFQQTTTLQSSLQNGSVGSSSDDVTTIFVVGFPDDMMEREFQNMFTFSPGFEAASLKWHCKDQDDDSTGLSNGKKQMIGFARFRTRMEAMEAVEVLSGKKIDQDKGAALKAEMAKKNLHIKRGSVIPTPATLAAIAQASASTSASTSTSTSTSANVPVESAPPPPPPLNMLSKKMSIHHSLAYESFSPLPSDLLSPADYKTDPFMSEPLSNTPIFNDALFGLRSQSFDARNQPTQEIGMMSPPRAFGFFAPRVNKALQHETENDPFNYLSKSSPTSNDNFTPPFFGDDMLSQRMGSISAHSSSTLQHFDHRSASFSSPSMRASISNPADQNPPCNTLYVGNLPANSNEEELRLAFAKCRGYKRMCFRNKPQGPMCFVEFEDVVFATQAMSELQGHTLTNSVKGGIRLSFSKNPLFTKPNGKEASFGYNGKAMNNSPFGDRRDVLFDPQL
ncbi:hypothetical protein CLU79DRAFT_737853 [Phycomyces nitens]|nr:hypothetical protein CLU79DRAFT_737853 [Phycomyces nitens]